MNLDELLKQTHPPKNPGDKKAELYDVFGIIYRIYCIPENKSYIGQTFSHGYVGKYLNKKNILSRIKKHYNDKNLDKNKNKPLYIDLSKYESKDFIIYEVEKIYKKEIGLINQKEGEYMEKYNSLYQNGYNLEEIGKKYPKILKDLSKFYDFEIKKFEYIDKTRDRRKKDICIADYFGFKNEQLSLNKILKLLKNVEVESVKLVDSNGLRIVIRIKKEKNNIRMYFKGNKDDCLIFSKKISDNIIISPSFIGKECYKYKLKLDKVLEDKDIITTITGKSYHNSSRDCDTYLIMVSGKKNNRIQTLHRISFGGKTIKINESYNLGIEFVEKIKENIDNLSVKYILENIS